MLLDEQEFQTDTVILDAKSGNECSTEIPEGFSGSTLGLLIRSQDGELLFSDELALLEEG